MQNRRDFLKTAALAALGSGLVVRQTLAGESLPYNINKLGLGGKMKMKFREPNPYTTIDPLNND